jgi:hypothetical protein
MDNGNRHGYDYPRIDLFGVVSMKGSARENRPRRGSRKSMLVFSENVMGKLFARSLRMDGFSA